MKIEWLSTFECEVVDVYDPDLDNIGECHNETFNKGETAEIDIIVDGDMVDIQFGNGSMILGLHRSCFRAVEPEYFNKITDGYVIQNYKRLPNGSLVCTGQEFVTGEVNYEDDLANTVDVDTEKEVYCPYHMVQPKPIPE